MDLWIKATFTDDRLDVDMNAEIARALRMAASEINRGFAPAAGATACAVEGPSSPVQLYGSYYDEERVLSRPANA